MTPQVNDPLAVALIELMLKPCSLEKDELGGLLSERAGRIHVAGHLVMGQIFGVDPTDLWFYWPSCCTRGKDFSMTLSIARAPAGTAERGLLETRVLACLAGVAAESIDDGMKIDQRRARLGRAAAERYLVSVEDGENVRHTWLAYLSELARAELTRVWHEVERIDGQLISFASSHPEKSEAPGCPILDDAVFQRVRDTVVESPNQEREQPGTPQGDTDRRQRNAVSIDDGMLDSRLDVLHFSPRYVKSLGQAGVATVRDLMSLRLPEIGQVQGIGKAATLKIAAVLNAKGYTYMPGDFPERWRRRVPPSEDEAAKWKTDPSAPIESLGLEPRLSGRLIRGNNIHSVGELLALSDWDLLSKRPGVSKIELSAIEDAMLRIGYALVGGRHGRRWRRADGEEPSGGSQLLPSQSDQYEPVERLSLLERVIVLLHSARLYTIADLLAASEHQLQRLGLDPVQVAQVTRAMRLKGYVLTGVPGKRRWVPAKR